MLELLSQDNNVTYNIKIADIFGLNSAVFIGLLITEKHRLTMTKKLRQDNYIVYERDQIFSKMFISDEKQIEIEDNLISCNILARREFKNNSRKNYYFLDTNMLSKLITMEYGDKRDKLLAKTNTVVVNKEKPMTKRQAMILNLKKGLEKEVDGYLYELVCMWIDEVYTKGKYLSKKGILINLEEIRHFDKEYQQEIIKTLAKKAWTDNKYALEYLNKFGTKQVSLDRREEINVQEIESKLNSGIEGVDYF